MGELILGQPALKIAVASSVPLDLISAISLMVRATDEQRFDRWLVNARQELDPEVRHDLEALLGFSGRLLYYIDELLMSFDPFRPEHLAASFENYLAHLKRLPAEDYRRMAVQSVLRIHEDRGMIARVPDENDRDSWRAFVEPGITRANPDEVIDLVLAPEQLKARTVRLIERFWRECYEPEHVRTQPDVQRALRRARDTAYRSVESAFESLGGRRLPDEVHAILTRVERVTLCPSYHVGDFIQFILYPPELILYFNCQNDHGPGPENRPATREADPSTELLPCLRALSDGTRLRILEMLRDEELYAQKIVGRLGISQSAVSRHLATLESAGIVQVRPANGMKYYAINTPRLQRFAAAIGRIG